MPLTSTQKRLLKAEFDIRFKRACEKISEEHHAVTVRWKNGVISKLTSIYTGINFKELFNAGYNSFEEEKLKKFFPGLVFPSPPPEPKIPSYWRNDNPAAHEFALTLEFMDGGLDDLNKTMDGFISDWLTKFAENRS